MFTFATSKILVNIFFAVVKTMFFEFFDTYLLYLEKYVNKVVYKTYMHFILDFINHIFPVFFQILRWDGL